MPQLVEDRAHTKKFHSYLGVVAREKISILHTSWKDVPDTLKDLVWDDILVSGIRFHYYFFDLQCEIYWFSICLTFPKPLVM